MSLTGVSFWLGVLQDEKLTVEDLWLVVLQDMTALTLSSSGYFLLSLGVVFIACHHQLWC